MEKEKNELSLVKEQTNNVYCTFELNTEDAKRKLYNAMEECDVLLNDVINQEIKLKDYYIEAHEVVVKDDKGNPVMNEVTGEVRTRIKYRSILFDEAGQTYATGAYGVFNALGKLEYLYDKPSTWKSPITIKVIKKNIGNGRQSLTFKLV